MTPTVGRARSRWSDLDRPPLNGAALSSALVWPDSLWTRLDVTESTGSTNADLLNAARQGTAVSGSVLIAEEQTAGRGRRGRSWFGSPGQTLLYSALLRPLGARPLLPLAVPLAICEASERLARVRCQLKWPNDVWVEGRKVAGVLIEGRPEADDGGWAVIGIGLNLSVPVDSFPEELRETAGSLGADAGPKAALEQLNPALAGWIERDPAEVLAAFRERDALRGRSISWQGGFGTAAGIDDDGHLLVDTADGSRAVLGAGEVHLQLD
jgi:BirA family biotin operon repressor/biotin-[acetyl-CoA-carboxylase] ligase